VEEIKDLTLPFIRKSPEEVLILDPSESCMHEMGVNVLSQSALSKILQDPCLEGEKSFSFKHSKLGPSLRILNLVKLSAERTIQTNPRNVKMQHQSFLISFVSSKSSLWICLLL
jgi:hypothetical protein